MIGALGISCDVIRYAVSLRYLCYEPNCGVVSGCFLGVVGFVRLYSFACIAINGLLFVCFSWGLLHEFFGPTWVVLGCRGFPVFVVYKFILYHCVKICFELGCYWFVIGLYCCVLFVLVWFVC